MKHFLEDTAMNQHKLSPIAIDDTAWDHLSELWRRLVMAPAPDFPSKVARWSSVMMGRMFFMASFCDPSSIKAEWSKLPAQKAGAA